MFFEITLFSGPPSRYLCLFLHKIGFYFKASSAVPITDCFCVQECQNTPGSFTCSCVPGYTLSAPATCTAVNQPPGQPGSLLVASTQHLARLHLDTMATVTSISTSSITSSSSSSSITDLAYDHRLATVCWLHSSGLSCGSMEAGDLGHTWSWPQPDVFR